MVTVEKFNNIYGGVQAGDELATYQMGNFFMWGEEVENGVNIPISPVSAFVLYKKAQKYTPAKIGLAECYLDGIGTKPNKKKAIRLLQEAVADGDLEALEMLQSLS